MRGRSATVSSGKIDVGTSADASIMRPVFKLAAPASRGASRFSKEVSMADPLYLARATIERRGSLHRVARLALGAHVEMGVHGPIKDHYRLSPARELPLPVDYIVAATGG